MSQYWKLRTINNPKHRAHVAERLRALRKQLREEVTDKTDENDLRLATWNLMHFGDGGAYWRDTDALLYISEIIDHFDLIALQEVNDNIEQLEQLMEHYLGEEWDYIVTDTTGGKLGNKERMAFVFRKGKVRFGRLSGEIILPDGQTIVGSADVGEAEDDLKTHLQFARSPFVVGFECGWFKFKLCTVHIYFGSPKKQKSSQSDAAYKLYKTKFMKLRKTEIRELANFLSKRQKNERKKELKRLKEKQWDTRQSTANYILLGDFNIISPEHETMSALKDNGFDIPPGMEDLSTNLGKQKRHYDQIAQRLGDQRIKHGTSGCIDFRKSIFRDEDADHYIDVVKHKNILKYNKLKNKTKEQLRKYFKGSLRKHQISDHLPLWSSFKVDLADNYLEQIESDAVANNL